MGYVLFTVLILAAVSMWFGVDASKLKEAVQSLKGRLSTQQWIALALVAVAFAFIPWGQHADADPEPVPNAGPLVLDGLFAGPTASDDACLVGCLCSELADEIEWDGMQQQSIYKTGVSLDELRKTARVMRCKGVSIGDRQPAARDAIADYLDNKVGTDGGPLSPEQRAAWVSALRDIGRAANDAAQ